MLIFLRSNFQMIGVLRNLACNTTHFYFRPKDGSSIAYKPGVDTSCACRNPREKGTHFKRGNFRWFTF